METTKEQRIRARSVTHNTLGVEGILELRVGTKKNDKHLITHMDMHKSDNKLVNA
jgi:hypothetical protein